MAVKGSTSVSKTFQTVALLTVASKVVGLVRDIIVAGAYGTSVLADAYNFAYLFTGNILILFGGLGGPFHSATVTVLTPEKENKNAGPLVAQIMLMTFLVLCVVALLLYALAPWIMHGIAAGYKHQAAESAVFFQEAIFQLRVMSPLAVIAGLVGVSYGVLNVYGRVLWPSISPAIASVAIILVLMLWPDRTTSVPLAVGTLIGAFGQLFAQLPDMSRCGLNFQLITRPVKGLGSYLALLWPAVFGTSIGQLTIYIDSFFCSNISEGAWTAISNANRIIQLPLGVLITAMIVPMLPRFAEHASQSKFDLLKKDFLKSLRFMLFMVMPLATVLILLPHQIVEVLFQRGAFNAHSTALVTTALIFYVPSILFYVGRDLITRAFYAMQDSRTPYYVAIVAIIVKAGLNWLFVYQLGWGVGGISFATSIITALNLVLLAFVLRTKIGRLGFSSLVIPVTKILIACLAMGTVMSMMQTQFGLFALIGGLPAVVSKLLCILAVSFIGLLIYAVVSYLLHVDDLFLVLEKYGLKKSSP